ncbi:glycosyltransferase [Paraburkholderia madseniana]|jgi:glycosyltransferase involved in cell wall biosynthesis|uniref:glycosyltransferase n=1 Tax=Paraburkholderia TaxID=1822464 RepID=UPI0038BB7345
MLVSIYLTTHNRLELLRRAVNTVLSQTYKEIELVIFDDGSTDGTQEYLLDLARTSDNVVYVRSEASVGACRARNEAISRARGEFITGLDDDDYYTSTRIADFVKNKDILYSKKPVAFLFTDFLIERANSRVRRTLPDVVSLDMLKQSNFVGCQIFTETSRLRTVGGFDAAMPAWQDYELWFRLVEKFGLGRKVSPESSYVVDVESANHRISLGGASRYVSAYETFYTKHSRFFSNKDARLLKLNAFAYPQTNFPLYEVLVSARYGVLAFAKYAEIYFRKKARLL